MAQIGQLFTTVRTARLPRPTLEESVPAEFALTKHLLYRDSFKSCATPERWILGWHFQDEEHEHERFWKEMDDPARLGRLLLRDELLRGDTRPLYLSRLETVHLAAYQAELELTSEAAADSQEGRNLHIQVVGDVDGRLETWDGETRFDFSWSGFEEMDPACGRGWPLLDEDVALGHFYFHMGDDSGITVERQG